MYNSTFYLTNKEASTVLCSVVKHAGSGRARKKCRGKHETQSEEEGDGMAPRSERSIF